MTRFVRYLICRQETKYSQIPASRMKRFSEFLLENIRWWNTTTSCRSAGGSMDDSFELQYSRHLSDLLPFIFTVKTKPPTPQRHLNRQPIRFYCLNRRWTQFKLPVDQISLSTWSQPVLLPGVAPENSSRGSKVVLNQLSGFTGKLGDQTSPWSPWRATDDPETSSQTLWGSELHRRSTSWNTRRRS